MKKYTLLLLIPVLLFLTACQKAADSKPQIVTTFEPMYEFTKAIVGDKVDIVNIVPANQEAHDFEPSAKDMTTLTNADAIVYNSKNLEKWASSAKNKGIKIEASTPVEKIGDDPHTWVSPKSALLEVRYIAEELSKKFPEYKEDFTKNADSYMDKLKKIDQDFDQLKTAKNKTFITQHEAFAYLGRDYGLTPVAITGLDPEMEPSSSTLIKLRDEMRKSNLNTVYSEENSSSKLAETLAREAGARLLPINPVEGLTDEQKKAGESYLTIMEENLRALKETIK
ncbi:metal ABC transporter solute-binding protein, Zn/Mn family [Lactococcus ileimucosae]|uniref:metal ABC transporter solute-binding protein, Zn/Mn family n=1 Tax=Lactococcus ileimucosae TaxID=2941329 RepID=UPI0020436026|nr:zinc ABC transporter substrate-binding protein [Lactococcus ileimucosae]